MNKVIIEKLKKKKSKTTLSVGKDESLVYLLIGLQPGSKEVIVNLNGRGATAKILGIFLGQKGIGQIKTVQHHHAPHTTSDLLVKSVMWNVASYSYQGLIRIDKQAQGADAYQRNDNLLISDKALVETKPELEILANDVRCTHGATTGKIDDQDLFYLTSKGVSKAEAEWLIIEGFLEEVINRIPENKKKRELEKQLKNRLSDVKKNS